jgi:hypothetical protein
MAKGNPDDAFTADGQAFYFDAPWQDYTCRVRTCGAWWLFRDGELIADGHDPAGPLKHAQMRTVADDALQTVRERLTL